MDAGIPLVIASDMNPLPRSIGKIASSFSSKVICPEGVLTRKDKRRIARDFLEKTNSKPPWKNQHEKDAVVAGYHAWKRVKGTVAKIEKKIPQDSVARGYVLERILREGGNVKETMNQFLKEKQKSV